MSTQPAFHIEIECIIQYDFYEFKANFRHLSDSRKTGWRD